jgi:Rod binding domain-containing protein
MKIKDLPVDPSKLATDSSKVQEKKEEMAMAFEKMFARRLVQEMTKGLFKQDDKQTMMSSGSGMYKRHIVDTLSQALAQEKKLGMADMVSRHWDIPTEEVIQRSELNTES